MTRQRTHRRASATGDPGREQLDGPAHGVGLTPADLVPGIIATDGSGRERALGSIQALAGNAAAGGVVEGTGHAGGRGVGHGAVSTRAADLTISRDLDDVDVAGPGDGLVPLDMSASTNVTESVGPVSESSYAVTASSLADVVAAIGGRSEAGHVGWAPALDFHQTDGIIDSVTISVSIDLEMPSWSPPSSMLPKARAEWTRWYAALRAHEQGHIDLVHQAFDGLAARLLGTSVGRGQRLFASAKASLAATSRAYDARTGNGTRQGTVMDVAIEQQELDEERRKREEAEAARKREPVAPTVGDEEG